MQLATGTGISTSSRPLRPHQPRLLIPLPAQHAVPSRGPQPDQHAARIRPAAVAAAAAPIAAAVSPSATAAALWNCIDPNVLGATLGASFKLFLVCAAVGYLLKSQRIENNTAAVMSKVSFNLLIPCMLFTKVATTLAGQPDLSVLGAISAFTLGQIVLGALLGEALGRLADTCFPPSKQEAAAETGSRPGIRPKTGLRQLVTLACSFGSSFTLPLVFFSTMLPGPLAERAFGYTALIMLSWSPCLWSGGLSIVNRGRPPPPHCPPKMVDGMSRLRLKSLELWCAVQAFAANVATPPFIAICLGVAAGTTSWGRSLLLGTLNPLAGKGGPAAIAVASAPIQLGVTLGIVRSAFDVVKMLSSGTLAAQSVVLAASLLQRPEGNSATTIPAPSEQRTAKRGLPGLLAGVGKLLLPSSATEARALLIVSLARFVLLPVLTVAGVAALTRLGLMPASVLADPVLMLVLMAEAVMPTAQNLIILLQLSPDTRPLAPTFAALMLKLYAWSVVPVTLWVSFFASSAGVQVA